MNKFGFEIESENIINYDTNDLSVAEYVLSREPSLYNCIQCGSCSAACPASAVSPYQFRKMQLLMRRGEIKQLRSDIEYCMYCGKCMLVCPRGVNTRNTIRQIRIALNNN